MSEAGPKNLIDSALGGRILAWGIDGIEPYTIEQAHKTSRLPFVHSHVALMPDAHVGIGSTVGSVIATDRAIIPAAVGVDIGCGMCCARLNVHAAQLPDDLGELHSAIAQAIPAGVGQGHARAASTRGVVFPEWANKDAQPRMVLDSNKLWQTATSQFGTLGSGNHFVEVCLDQDDSVWLVLHSGSRGIGNQIAKRHIDGAKKLMKQYFINLEDTDLAYFAQGTPEFEEYIHDMLWAQEYARTNREQMMSAAIDAFERVTTLPAARQLISCHHNYTEQEHHSGRDLWVTRKGAIRAREGDWGIIPGSMATGTYIVRGLGNPASFTSASHGAGRRMSRGVARRTITPEELNTQMAGKAWNAASVDALLDEAPAAYKPIEDVMAAQADLVRVEYELHQVLNFKGQ